MNNPPDNWSEQLSAYIDGELPEAEARFLQRRLEHDAELRGKWMRMQLAGTCIKGQPWQPMCNKLSDRVQTELAHGSTTVKTHRPLLRWAMVASIAALAVIFAPRLMRDSSPDSAPIVANTGAPAADHMLASPASADLVALRTADSPLPAPAVAVATTATTAETDFIRSNPDASAKASPIPLSAQSPTDFPLIDTGDKRTWPRSELIAGASDPSLEAYLVRHNQMLANDGLGGFVPYVDVVASDQPATTPESEDGADEQ